MFFHFGFGLQRIILYSDTRAFIKNWSVESWNSWHKCDDIHWLHDMKMTSTVPCAYTKTNLKEFGHVTCMTLACRTSALTKIHELQIRRSTASCSYKRLSAVVIAKVILHVAIYQQRERGNTMWIEKSTRVWVPKKQNIHRKLKCLLKSIQNVFASFWD